MYNDNFAIMIKTCFSNMQKTLNTALGDDEYTTARKEVLTHMCSRPMQVRAQLSV